MKNLKLLLDSLSDKEKEAILNCEDKGNGPYFYQIHKLLEKGLMEFIPVAKFMNAKVPRLGKLGLIVKDLIEYQSDSKTITELYYTALVFHTKRYKKMLADSDIGKTSSVIIFCDELIDSCENSLPLCKMNRWFGYIQREVISLGLTTVEEERNITRPYFRPLDFSEIFYL